jgi:putative chitinase
VSAAITTLASKARAAAFNHFAAAAAIILANRPALASSAALDRALQAVAPHLSATDRAAWATALIAGLPHGSIGSTRAIAAFLGQCAVESGGFTALEENLNYTAARLCQVWPSRFPSEALATACADNPERLANTVYANRLGNGDPESGDGWRFRGRGLIQMTGRTAYQSFAQSLAMNLDDAVDHAATRQGAVDSAVCYWAANNLNALANAWSLDNLTKRINGGTNGAVERARLCQAALHALGGS